MSSTGYITWIVKKDAFRKFHNMKIGEFMVSEEVTKEKMVFYMKCFPNGAKHKFEGWVGLSLTLKKSSIPSNITNILVRYYLYESQTSSVARGVARFSNNDIIFMNDNNNDNKSNSSSLRRRKNSFIDVPIDTPSDGKKSSSGHAKANGTNYLCNLEALKTYNIVSLVCEFQIIRMYKLGTLIYGKPLKLKKIIKYKWDILNKNLEKFKLCNNAYTRLYSKEFNIYNLVLVPSATTVSSKGNISLRLRIHELPPIIKAITVIVVLSCKQFDRSWTSITSLSYDQPWISWPSNTLKKSIVDETISQTNNDCCISFECHIEILNIDLQNLIINDLDTKYKDVWNKFIDDASNIFMFENNDNNNNIDIDTNIESKTNDNDQHDHKMYDMIDGNITDKDEGDDDDDEYLIYKKEELVRIEILKSLDLNESGQKEYLMNKFFGVHENIRILRKQNHLNTKIIKQLQSTIKSIPENMFSCLSLQLNSVLNMGASASDDGDEKNAHKVLVIRTKDSSGYLLIGANKQGGYYHSKKYVSFSHSDSDITVALSLWDTPAIDFSANVHDQVTAPYYQYAHGLFCVYNVESIDSFNLICNKISYFYKNPQKTPFRDVSKVAMMLIGHKTKHFNESMRRVPQQKAIKYANAIDITFFEVSSSNWQDMSDLYTIIGKSIYQIYGELPLQNKQNMTEMLDVAVDTKQQKQTKPKPKSPATSIDDEKVNDINNLSESESISELSDLEIDEPTQTKQKFKRSKHKKKENETKSRGSDEMPLRHRSSNEHKPSSERRHKDSIECSPVSVRFKQFIEERVQMPYLYELFSKQHYDDIRMIEYFDEDMLKNEIGIKNLIHRKLFLQQCNDLKFEIEQFRKWLVDRLQLRRYLPIFEANGLITMNEIAKEINSQSDFQLKLKIVNRNHQQILWHQLQIYESAINDSDYNDKIINNNNNDDNKQQSSINIMPPTPTTPNKSIKVVKTKMTNAYANIQRNKQIFNAITKNNQYKQDTNRMSGAKNKQLTAKSTRDLESMMTNIQLDGIDDDKPSNPNKNWQRSSSLKSTLSPSSYRKSSFGGSTTPRGTDSNSINNKTLHPKKPKKKRRKSFSLGMY